MLLNKDSLQQELLVITPHNLASDNLAFHSEVQELLDQDDHTTSVAQAIGVAVVQAVEDAVIDEMDRTAMNILPMVPEMHLQIIHIPKEKLEKGHHMLTDMAHTTAHITVQVVMEDAEDGEDEEVTVAHHHLDTQEQAVLIFPHSWSH